MALASGTRLAHYEIADSVGVGGMGEVYRALDTKLERDVAIKVLPEEFTRDEERLARFEREAKLLASLNHAHIATLHGLESADGTRFLVMELVEGETLAERLARGPLALEEAVALFGQIAEAIEAAHRKGVVHRDLKPANIKVTPEGKVKVLDFGLAKAFEGEHSDQDLSQSPTAAYTGTRAGVILGTAAYMSPEQARGKPIDKRTDVWSFGVCLYEALSGKKPFRGETATDTIAALVRAEPDWREVPATTPARLSSLLHRCLQKDPERRLRDVGDAHLELEDALSEPVPEGAQKRPVGFAMFAVSVAAAVLAGVVVGRATTSAPPERVAIGRFSLELTSGTHLDLRFTTSVAISPDGETIAFIANTEDGQQGLYVRDIESFEPRSIAGTEGAAGPFFSPDGAWIGYFDGSTNEMKRVRVDGGAPIVICQTGDSPRGASWGADGTIYFNSEYFLGLSRVSASGGEPEVLTTPDRDAGEKSHRFPELLPDGRSLLFLVGTSTMRSWDDARIAVLDLDSGEVTLTSEGGNSVRYLPSGDVVYGRDGTLLAASFDTETHEIIGAPRQILDRVVTSPVFGVAHYAVSSSGTLAYVPGGTEHYESTAAFIERGGRPQPLPLDPGNYFATTFSPDGRKVAIWRDNGNAEVWVYDVVRQTSTRLVSGWDNEAPVWTPDGQEITFQSNRRGSQGIFSVGAAGNQAPAFLIEEEGVGWPSSWSPDGETLFFTMFGDRNDVATWSRSDGSVHRLFNNTFNARGGVVSPDGRWLAYLSDASGRQELSVAPFPGVDSQVRVSLEGARGDWKAASWSTDGRKIYYRSGDGIKGALVTAGSTFEVGPPETLFAIPNLLDFDVSPDGETFAIITANTTPVTHLNVVLNWLDELP